MCGMGNVTYTRRPPTTDEAISFFKRIKRHVATAVTPTNGLTDTPCLATMLSNARQGAAFSEVMDQIT